MKDTLVLDFDGLICDGLKECALVTWNGYYRKSLADFSDVGFDEIPQTFIKRFEVYRSFAKHLGQFLVPLLDTSSSIYNQQGFDAFYQSLLEEEILTFKEQASQYRNQARQEKTTEWLQYHQLYPGMAQFLSSLQIPVYIVTAKDTDSVISILQHAGVPFSPHQVFGEQQAKEIALQEIMHRENTSESHILFFDDNVYNVLQARRSGFTASWALWGYHVPDHLETASHYNIPAIHLPDFFEWMGNLQTLNS